MQQWQTTIFGNNGRLYNGLLISSIVLICGIAGVFIYVYSPGLPISIKVILLACCLVLLHQAYVALHIYFLLRKTARVVTINDTGTITLQLFSNKTVNLSDYSITNGVPIGSNKVFPKGSNATLMQDGSKYYLTSTVDGFQTLYRQLLELNNKHNKSSKPTTKSVSA